VSAPAVINGRLSKPGEIDRFRVKTAPGDKLLIEVQARELGTSKLEGVITAWDSSGKKIDSAGDKPLPEDVFAVQGTSRTSSDPFLNLTVPPNVNEIVIGIEDLAARGGPLYAYRLMVRRQAEDFRLALISPYVNVPKGGTTAVVVAADRRGYDGPIQLAVENLPKGIHVEGGYIPRETVDANNNRSFNRRGMLILYAEPNIEMTAATLVVTGTAKLADGTMLTRRASGSGMAVDVAGATAQGVVDRQRAVTAPWLGLDLPAGVTTPQIAALEVKQVNFTRMAEGDRYDFQYEWRVRSDGLPLPKDLTVDVVGARDIRVTAFEKNGNGGTFSINITKATDPATYDIIVRGKVQGEDIYARRLPLVVTERSENVQAASAR
jgi:hypothetical protein